MAHNLLKAGHSLVVYDLSPAALDRVAAQAKALNLTGEKMEAKRRILIPRMEPSEIIWSSPKDSHDGTKYSLVAFLWLF